MDAASEMDRGGSRFSVMGFEDNRAGSVEISEGKRRDQDKHPKDAEFLFR